MNSGTVILFRGDRPLIHCSRKFNDNTWTDFEFNMTNRDLFIITFAVSFTVLLIVVFIKIFRSNLIHLKVFRKISRLYRIRLNCLLLYKTAARFERASIIPDPLQSVLLSIWNNILVIFFKIGGPRTCACSHTRYLLKRVLLATSTSLFCLLSLILSAEIDCGLCFTKQCSMTKHYSIFTITT